MTTYLSNKILDHVTGNSAYTPPQLYIALYKDTNAEVSNSGSYSRKPITFTNTGTAEIPLYKNNNIITWTPTGTWGWIYGFRILDSGTYGAGNILYTQAFTTPSTVYPYTDYYYSYIVSGVPYSIKANAIEIGLL